MAIDFTVPLNWKGHTTNPEIAALLQDLQGNILKGHGRHHTRTLFFSFNPDFRRQAREFLCNLNAKVVSALAQLEAAEKFKQTGESGGAFTAVMLTAEGYRALGIDASLIPDNPAFLAGMPARQAILSDPPQNEWDPLFALNTIHAMVLLADDTAAKVANQEAELLATAPVGVKHLGTEIGRAYFNGNGDGVEHFGYVDGRSQPLLLVEDVEQEKTENGGIDNWNPAFGIGRALVPSPAGNADASFGSYFIFRKLEQNVKGFKENEERIADDLGLQGADRERAGALIVGRFEDGSPLVQRPDDGNVNPVTNNFSFDNDVDGNKCPFHAHIRKTNPRGDVKREFGLPDDTGDRNPIMARRGITYGERATEPVGKGTEFTDEPEGGVGLLFMAYNVSLEEQFEFTQQSWANNPDFVRPATGIDPIIGQGAGAPPSSSPDQWGKPNRVPIRPFSGHVRMKGGEYFFAPSKSTLANLCAESK